MNGSMNSIGDFAVRQGIGFVRTAAAPPDLLSDLRALDAALSGNRGYIRTDRLEPLSDMALIEKCRAESERFAASMICAKVLDLYRRSCDKLNKTTETNLVVCIMYWTERTLTGRGSAGEVRKLIYSGKCGYKEYLFCYYASLIGFDVLLIPQESDISQLPKGLLEVSQPFVPTVSAHPAAAKPQAARNSFTGNTASPSQARNAGIDLERHTPRKNRPQTGNTYGNSGGAFQKMSARNNSFASRPAPSVQQNQPRQELSFEALASRAKSVVMITALGNDNLPLARFSGIIVGSHGYILANNHAVRNGSAFLVRIENDNNVYQAYQVIKYHTNYDLAIIRIARECEPISIYRGNEDLARGQRVCAIGSPMGLFNSVSDGIISGFRKMDDMDMIQFTAPISDGSSGGALLNMYGELIGICTAGIRGQNLNLAVSYRQILPFVQGFI